MRDAAEYIKAEKTALRLIARAEQCSGGLSLKLEKKGFDEICIRDVISRLFELNLLDDRRFARMWLQTKIRFAKSPRRLFSSLCRRGIDREDAQAAMKETLDEETEFSMLRKFAEKKSWTSGADNTRSLKHLLKNEGFSTKAVQRFLEENQL